MYVKQLVLGTEPDYTDTFSSRDWREFDRRFAALNSVYQEAREYNAPVEAYTLFEELQRAMRVNQLPETEPRQPRVTWREVTNDPIVAKPRKLSPLAVFVTRVVTFLF